ncbi:MULTISPECIES: hypothetical protein [unclassified Nostoc]|uniref:hypothetical protein n=1 Tax=unclassified Nostoc TaxID=2593658 RepID=UPI002AD26ADC|nr:hypothetical protein [Nostoc sp. DedVER01b]MDZ7989199.1 hypothetical protein [Nostoc sp. DedVER02]MDZ8113000.1 hypothetical protein [Nostoc sp. DedVER01b]
MSERSRQLAIIEMCYSYLKAMTQTAAITEAITTLQDAENRFAFVRIEDEQFFPEWYQEYCHHAVVESLL